MKITGQYTSCTITSDCPDVFGAHANTHLGDATEIEDGEQVTILQPGTVLIVDTDGTRHIATMVSGVIYGPASIQEIEYISEVVIADENNRQAESEQATALAVDAAQEKDAPSEKAPKPAKQNRHNLVTGISLLTALVNLGFAAILMREGEPNTTAIVWSFALAALSIFAFFVFRDPAQGAPIETPAE